MTYDFFIASRWRNKDEVLVLADKLRRKGKIVYCFLDAENEHLDTDKDPHEAMKEFEATPDWRNDVRVKKMFDADMEGIQNSETLILLLPAGKSAHLEAGYAYGLGKTCILIGVQIETESNYLLFNQSYKTIDEFLNSLEEVV